MSNYNDWSDEQRRLLKAFREYTTEHYFKAIKTIFESQNGLRDGLYWHIIRYLHIVLKKDDEEFYDEIIEWIKNKNTFSECFPKGKNDENSLEYIVKMPEFRPLFEKYS